MTQDTLRTIKQHFMAMRNGVVADTLRSAGLPHRVIFGLNLPQIAAIARDVEQSEAIASALWEDKNVRESRLLAAYLMPPDRMTPDKAIGMAGGCTTREEADILCFRLLRRLSFAESLADTLEASSDFMTAYCGKALRRNLEHLRQ